MEIFSPGPAPEFWLYTFFFGEDHMKRLASAAKPLESNRLVSASILARFKLFCFILETGLHSLASREPLECEQKSEQRNRA